MTTANAVFWAFGLFVLKQKRNASPGTTFQKLSQVLIGLGSVEL